MIHDLTANSDFANDKVAEELGKWLKEVNELNDCDMLKSPKNEIILTGSAFERKEKRYILDYMSSGKNICDCCGTLIRTKPWDFSENKTLCPSCEKWLEMQYGPKGTDGLQDSENNTALLEEIVDDTFKLRIVKPWDMNNKERESPINNVLIWD